jgi:hypothetical protein
MTVAGNMTVNQAGGPPPRLTAPENLPPVFSDPVFQMTNNPETGGTEQSLRSQSSSKMRLSLLPVEDQLWNSEINEGWISPSRLRN